MRTLACWSSTTSTTGALAGSDWPGSVAPSAACGVWFMASYPLRPGRMQGGSQAVGLALAVQRGGVDPERARGRLQGLAARQHALDVQALQLLQREGRARHHRRRRRLGATDRQVLRADARVRAQDHRALD